MTKRQKRLWYCNVCGVGREKLVPNIVKGKRRYLCEECDKMASEAYREILVKREARRRQEREQTKQWPAGLSRMTH